MDGSDVEAHDVAEDDVEDGGGGLGGPRHGVGETVLRPGGNVGDGDGRLDVGSRLHRVFRREVEFDLGVGLRPLQDPVGHLAEGPVAADRQHPVDHPEPEDAEKVFDVVAALEKG